MIDKRNVLDKGFVELLAVMGNDMTVVNAARVSYLSESKGDVADKKLINYLMRHRHTSPLEQVEFQWRVKCPLFVRSQWHRHRTWSYNEISRRYTSENIEFYLPSIGSWRFQSPKNRQSSISPMGRNLDDMVFSLELDKFNNMCYTYYKLLLDRGVAREQARMVLPQSLYTIFYAKVDLHNLLHFIGLRSNEHAQWEIQQYSNAMLEMIEPIVPWTVEAWRDCNNGYKTSSGI